MKNLIIVSLLTCLHWTINAQSTKNTTEIAAIQATLNQYIEGTAYGYPEKLRSAFIPEAQLFLDHKEKPLFVMTIEAYADHMAKHEERGKFNGRTTNMLSIDHFEGIATAKLEVIVPEFEMRFIDMILLKKLEEGWKIISKTAGSESSNHQGKKVNSVPDNHESRNLPHYEHYPFIIETVLKERGGIFKHSDIRTPRMEFDGRLVTGQNSLSSKMVTKKNIEVYKRTRQSIN